MVIYIHASDMYNFSLIKSEHTPYNKINPPNVAAIVETVESISILNILLLKKFLIHVFKKKIKKKENKSNELFSKLYL